MAGRKPPGSIVVAASGNDGSNNDSSAFYPANYSTRYANVVSVTASTQSDAVANYANTGAGSVTIAAPGENVLSTLPGNRYARAGAAPRWPRRR